MEITFERRDGDHYHIYSRDIPGLHLAGRNLDELNALLESVIKDLFWHNSDIAIDSIRWVPSLKDVGKLARNSPNERPLVEKKAYVVNVRHAA